VEYRARFTFFSRFRVRMPIVEALQIPGVPADPRGCLAQSALASRSAGRDAAGCAGAGATYTSLWHGTALRRRTSPSKHLK